MALGAQRRRSGTGDLGSGAVRVAGSLASGVRDAAVAMAPAVNFNDELASGHQEVDHVLAEHHLTPHRRAEFSSAEHCPEGSLRAGGHGAHLGGAFGEGLLAAELMTVTGEHGFLRGPAWWAGFATQGGCS